MESGGNMGEVVRDEKVEKDKDEASSENNKANNNNKAMMWADSSNKQRRLSKKKSSRGRSFRLRSDTLNTLRLRRVFDLFDKNADGLVSLSEIRQALVLLGLDDDDDDHDGDDVNKDQQQHQDRGEQDELDSIVTSFVKPGNHGLTFEDFEALHDSLSNNTFFFDCLDDDDDDGGGDGGGDGGSSVNPITKDATEEEDLEQQVESDLTEAFKVFDSNGDGYISAMELQQVLSKLGFPEAQQELPNIQLMLSSFDHNRDGRVDFFEFKHMMSRTLLLPS